MPAEHGYHFDVPTGTYSGNQNLRRAHTLSATVESNGVEACSLGHGPKTWAVVAKSG